MDDFMTGFVAGQDSGDNRNNGGFGDGGWIWAFLILAMFGGWGGGFGGFGGGGAAQGTLTRSDLCSEFAFNDLQSGVRGISQGICDSTFALNNTMTNGFHGVDNALCQGFNNVAQQLNNISFQNQQCCCETQRAIDGVNYNMAKNTCDIQNTINTSTRDLMENQNANTRSILDFMVQSKISSLESENQTLRLAASQANQNAVIGAQIDAASNLLLRRLEQPAPVPAYQVPNPNAAYYGHCGCGCACA